MNSICCRLSPEGALRLQAGGGAQRNPCNDAYNNQNPDGVTDILSCLQHLLMVSLFAGVTLRFTPAYVLSHFQCSRSTDISLLKRMVAFRNLQERIHIFL